MESKKIPRQLSYTLPPELKSPFYNWTAKVSLFYTTTLKSADPASYTLFAADSYVQKSERVQEELAATSEDKPKITPVVSDGVESLAVHYAVQLTSILGHILATIRISAASLLFELANLLESQLSEKALEPILLSFETNEHGYQDCVHELFKATGKQFSVMVIAFVAGLECFNTSTDWRVRGICNAALARLVFENERIFLQEDHLSAIWNLYFSLSSIPLISKVFPDRIVIVRALELLAPIYTLEDPALSVSVADALLRLSNKTRLETDAIKSTLSVIFKTMCEKRANAVANANAKPEGLYGHGSDIDDVYEMFLNLITPHDESAYDLLSWAFEAFTLNMYALTSPSTAQNGPPILWFPALNSFILSLSNHFRAQPALVRYGSSVALHSTIKICPSFTSENKQMWLHIVAGILDTDYLSAFLYLSIIEMTESIESPEIRKLVSKLRRSDTHALSYDDLFVNSTALDKRESSRVELLDLVVKRSPAIAPILLHKMANSLDFLPRNVKLKQLQLIRIWGKKTEKLDMFLMQLLVPLCHSPDRAVQMETVRVIQSLLPAFATAEPSDVAFLWGYLIKLLEPSTSTGLLNLTLNLMKSFPLIQLSTLAREEFLTMLFKNIFNHDPHIRASVYGLIGASAEFWKLSGDTYAALSILLLALGDNNSANAKLIVDQIFVLGTPMLTPIFLQLGAVRDSVTKPLGELIKAYDGLATAFASRRAEFRPILDSMIQVDRVNEFWKFFLHDVPDNQLARPDEYPYHHNFIQAPYWISLFLTKFSVPPPPLLGDTVRDVMPKAPAGKRRFICGFMQCLFPTAGMPDPYFRYSACLAIVRCCFKGVNVHTGMLRSLLEYLTQQMLPHKHWSYQSAALDILGMIVRLKIPGVAESVMQQYLDLSIDFLYNAPSEIIKTSVLNFLEILLLVFPKATQSKLQEIRDATRVLLADKDLDVMSAACRLYPLVFRSVSITNAPAFERYLQEEIDVISAQGLEAAGDPLVANLSKDDVSRILSLSILSLGMITQTNTPSYPTAQSLLRFVMQSNTDIRATALISILNMLQGMDPVESSAMIWILMPLYADPCKKIRSLFIRFLKNIPNVYESRYLTLPPHADDLPVLPLTSWEEVLTDTATLAVISKNLTDLMSSLDEMDLNPFSLELTPDDDCFHLPTISEKLMKRFKALSQATTTVVPPAIQSQVVYFLNEMQKVSALQANSILVLSEFCCQHEVCIPEVSDTMVNVLSQDLSPQNSVVIEACMLGLRNMSQSSPGVFKQILAKITAPSIPNEGDLLALFFMADLIKINAPNRASELILKFIPVVVSSRHVLRKRIAAAYLVVELSLFAGAEEIKNVLDAITTLLESVHDPKIKEQLHKASGRILLETGPKHQLFKSITSQARSDVRSKDPQKRLQALAAFRIFGRHLTEEETMWYAFQFLADSNSDIRSKAAEMLVHEKLLEFAYTALQKLSPKSGRRALLIEACRLPALDQLGISLSGANQTEEKTESDSTLDDPYNVNYYKSDRRRKFSKMFGLSESGFSKAVAPMTESVLKYLENRATAAASVSPEYLEKVKWLTNLENISILHELINFQPQVAGDLIEKFLAELETGTKKLSTTSRPDSPDEMDVESAAHKIDVLSNLLIAHDGIGTKCNSWISRYEALITYCSNTANQTRETLYNDLEKSFYFYNDYVDIPIISDEQFETLEKMKEANQDATLEIVKSGKTEKFSYIETKRNELNGTVDTKSDQLRGLTIVALHMLSGYGLFYSLSLSYKSQQLADGFRFLTGMLDNDHRGIRMIAVEALITMVQVQLEAARGLEFVDSVAEVVTSMLKKVQVEYPMLYRRKGDMATLMAKLSVYIPRIELRNDIIRLLIKMWRDPDNEVRTIAIRMIQFMGEKGVQEVLDCFQEKSKDVLETSIMSEVATLVNNEDYGEKDILQELLIWRFSLPKSTIKATTTVNA